MPVSAAPSARLGAMVMNTAQQFTAARIAEALGEDSQTQSIRLRAAAPFSGKVTQNGHDVRAWTWRALDDETRRQLDERAAAAGYSSGELFLTHATVDWMCVAPQDRERAGRLCRALRPALSALQAGQSREAVLRLAVEKYREEFGYLVSEKNVGKRLDRVVHLDAGAKSFDRLHLYLPARYFAETAGKPAPGGRMAEIHEPLTPWIETIPNRGQITKEDRRLLLSAAFRHLSQLERPQDDLPAGALKTGLVDWLITRVPGLAASRDALRKQFDRGYARWLQGGGNVTALERKRRDFGSYHVCEGCLKKIHDAAAHYHGPGRQTLAYRELRKRGLLCESCMSGIKFDLRKNKSYMPNALRRRTKPTPLTIAWFRSPRDAELNGPHPERDYSDLQAGDRFVLDDETNNEPVAVPLSGGRWEFWKVQLIAAEDMRSSKWLDFVMHYGHPFAWGIQRLFRQIYYSEAIGMPRRGLYLEHGVFKSAIASQRTVENGFDIRQMFDRLGVQSGADNEHREILQNLRVRRAELATAKTIEGHFHGFQDLASMLPGHLGFNERQDKFDLMKEFMDRCRSGKEDPRQEGILTIDDLRLNFRRIMEEMNAEPQNGRRCRGASPNEIWAEGVGNRPLERLPEALSYLFSTHGPILKPVTSGGIVIPKIDGTEDAVYYGDKRLGAYEDQRVPVFYSKLDPEVLIVRINAQETFTLKRQKYPSDTATRGQMQEMQRARWNHLSHARITAGNITHPLGFTIEREDKFPESQLEMGRQHNQAVADAMREGASESREIAGIRREARALGLTIDSSVDLSNPRIRMGAKMELKALRAGREEDIHR